MTYRRPVHIGEAMSAHWINRVRFAPNKKGKWDTLHKLNNDPRFRHALTIKELSKRSEQEARALYKKRAS